MYITSKETEDIILHSGRTFTARIDTSDKSIGNIKSVKLSRATIGNDTLTIGNTFSANATVITEALGMDIEGEEGQLFTAINGEDIPHGKFIVTNQITKGGLTTLTMADKLSTNGEKLYESELRYPANDIDVLNEIAAKLGVRFEYTTHNSLVVREKPQGLTIRETLGYIAGKHGKNAVINRNGNIELVWFNSIGYDLGADQINAPELSEKEYVVKKLNIAKSDTVKYTKGANQIEISGSNPLYEDGDIDVAFDSVKNLTYRIGNVDMPLGDPRLDPWDIVRYNDINIPCMQIELNYDGGIRLTIKSIGKTEVQNQADYKGPMTKNMERYYAELVTINKALIDKLDVNTARITYATISELNVTNEAVIKKLNSADAEILYAKITDLDVEKAKINNIEANMLTADSAVIKTMQTDVADINTLIFGSATGSVIQTEFANSVIAQLGNAQIKNAMIDSISAGKITSGKLYTNLVEITSQSGNIDIKDNTFKITDDNSTVRVQIGKDASNDYNMYVWDALGNLMFDALGLTENGIKREIIRNDMVSENANISASKLDIESLFNVINEDGSHTLKSSKIYVDADNQTLDVSFKTMTTNISSASTIANNAYNYSQSAVATAGTANSTASSASALANEANKTAKTADTNASNAVDVANNANSTANTANTNASNAVNVANTANSTANMANTNANNALNKANTNATNISALTETVTTQGTDISVIQGQISSKIWQSDITTAVNNVQIGGRNLAIGTSNEYSEPKAFSGGGTNKGISVSKKVLTDGLSIGDTITVQLVYKYIDIVAESGYNATAMINGYGNVTQWNSGIFPRSSSLQLSGSGEYKFEYTSKITEDHLQNEYWVVGVRQDHIQSGSVQFKMFKVEKGNKATDWSPAPEDVENEISVLSTKYTDISQTVDGISATVASHTTQIATKADNTAVAQLQSNVTELTADLNGFKTTVSSTYTTKAEFNDLEVGGRNYIINSNFQNGFDNWYLYATGSNVTYEILEDIAYGHLCKVISDRKDRGISVSSNNMPNIEAGTELVYSIYAKADSEMTVYLATNGSGIASANSYQIGTEWQRIVMKTTQTGTNFGIRIYGLGTYYVTNVKLEIGNMVTDWSPAPEDVENEISTVETHISSVEQTADKINWLVKSGTSSSDFTLTDRLAELTAEIISLNGNVKVSGSMLVDGAVTASKIATNAIKSRNYSSGVSGSYLNLSTGDFLSPNISITQANGVEIKHPDELDKTDDLGYVWKRNSSLDQRTIRFTYHGDKDSTDQHKVKEVFIGSSVPSMYFKTGYAYGQGGMTFSDIKYGTTPGSGEEYTQVTMVNFYMDEDLYIMPKAYGGPGWPDIRFMGCFRTSELGANNSGTFNNPIFVYDRFRIEAEYPQIIGDETVLQLNHNYDSSQGLVLESGAIRPAGDASQTLGKSGKRWSTIYSSSSVISTSDRNEKNTIESINDEIVRRMIMKLSPVTYKYNNGTSDRTHYGLIAQDVEKVLNEIGISSKDFAGLIKSPIEQEYEEKCIDEKGNEKTIRKSRLVEGQYRYGLRYEEFIAPMIKMLQMHEESLTDVNDRLDFLTDLIQHLIGLVMGSIQSEYI